MTIADMAQMDDEITIRIAGVDMTPWESQTQLKCST